MAESTTSVPGAPELSPAEYAARITSRQLTQAEAISLWMALTTGSEASAPLAPLFDELASGFATAAEWVATEGVDAERTALAALALGRTTEAQDRYNALAAAEARPVDLLWRMADLFATVDPGIAVNALARVSGLVPDDVDALWLLGRMLERLGQLQSAQTFLEQLLALEGKDDRQADAAVTLLALANVAESSGRLDVASDRLRQAIEIRTQLGNAPATVALRYNLGLVEWRRQNYAEAREQFEQVVATCQETGDQQTLADTLLMLGELATLREDPGSATAHFERARAICGELGDAEGLGGSAEGLGKIFLQRKDWPSAIQHFRAAIDHYTAADKISQRARSRYRLGLALRDGGDIDAARAQLELSLPELEKAGSQDYLEKARAALGALDPAPVQPPQPAASEYPLNSREYFWDRITICTLTGADADAMWKRVVEAAKASPQPGMQAVEDQTTLVDFREAVLDIIKRGDGAERLALVQLADFDFAGAGQRYDGVVAQAGERLAEKLWIKGALFAPTHPAIAASAWEQLLQVTPGFHYARRAYGRTLERIGDAAGAETQYRTILTSANDNPKEQAWAANRIGELLRSRGDYEGASHLFQRSLQLFRELGDQHQVSQFLRILGSVAAQSGDRAGAEIFIREALEVAAAAGDPDNVNRALKLLDALAKYGDHSAATLAAIRDAEQARQE